ncbi:hypothetical protein RhiirC2_805287 [Rhizophagus irregularis]|uniref:Uncharacterized protein n=1 Tax=Rhizophagus irregularis TaxID=588596 RepID=A0A2N1KUM0_9GLOM|nr:hypothetical protein RhiirC2_805287 [Rhizophagus irregularis]
MLFVDYLFVHLFVQGIGESHRAQVERTTRQRDVAMRERDTAQGERDMAILAYNNERQESHR